MNVEQLMKLARKIEALGENLSQSQNPHDLTCD
jgi:hypothetical protein